ncbi:MAG: FtsX-like permease family protein, partial [Bacteroidales bacterium]
MITEIAWKNVWRNRTRSLIVITAVTIGVFAGVFTIAAMNSSVVQRIDSAINEELSHIQINTKDFRKSGDINSIIPDYPQVIATLDTIPGVSAVTGRIILRGMASTAAKSAGVEIDGINPEKEKKIFTLYKKLIPGTGTYFGTKTKLGEAFLGEKLARDLDIIRYILTPEALSDLGHERVPSGVISRLEPLKDQRFVNEKKFTKAFESLLTPSESKKYGLKIIEAAWSYRQDSKIILSFLDVNNVETSAAFRVTGIFRINNTMFEESHVFVTIDELRQLTGLKQDQFQRIIVKLDNNNLTGRVTEKIREDFPHLEVLSWKEIQPDLALLSDMMQMIYGIFMAIILAALAFGIVNTMLMAVLERTREIGMLAAIGMNRKKIFLMIMLESVFLSITGGISGMAVGGAVIALTARHGIN